LSVEILRFKGYGQYFEKKILLIVIFV